MILCDDQVDPARHKRYVDVWLRAETAGLHRDRAECEREFNRVAADAAGTVIEPCARIALSEWLLYLGYFIEGERALPAAPGRYPGVAQWRAFQQGRLAVSQGIYDEGERAYAAATAGPSPVLADYARLYRGECLEFSGQWPQACKVYEDLSRTASAPDAARRAKFATSRLTGVAKEYKPAFEQTAYYWAKTARRKAGGASTGTTCSCCAVRSLQRI
jgi:hypothetical protein